jgi:hypothetical protein
LKNTQIKAAFVFSKRPDRGMAPLPEHHMIFFQFLAEKCRHFYEFFFRNLSLLRARVFEIFFISNIRKGKYRPATPTTTRTTPTRSGYLPWILKRGGLESSGRIVSS